MKSILIFNGSPRKKGNTSALVEYFSDGAKKNTNKVEILNAGDLDLNYCTGCLRCNLIGRCGQRGDEWENIANKIQNSDVLVFASPIYFHHLTAQMKKVIDRFRSFMKVQITETGLQHKAVKKWEKDIVLLLTMGSSDDSEAKPVVDLFNYISSFFNKGKDLYLIKGTRLAVSNQLKMNKIELKNLYKKMKIPIKLAPADFERNNKLLEKAHDLGLKLSK